MLSTMPRPSKLNLPPVDMDSDAIGSRIAYLRKKKGLTQIQLAQKMGLTQGLVSAYERGRLRLHAEMLGRFALALEVSADVILGLKSNEKKKNGYGFSLKLIRRMQKIEALPHVQQKILLQTIDTFLKGAQK